MKKLKNMIIVKREVSELEEFIKVLALQKKLGIFEEETNDLMHEAEEELKEIMELSIKH